MDPLKRVLFGGFMGLLFHKVMASECKINYDEDHVAWFLDILGFSVIGGFFGLISETIFTRFLLRS